MRTGLWTLPETEISVSGGAFEAWTAREDSSADKRILNFWLLPADSDSTQKSLFEFEIVWLGVEERSVTHQLWR
jgi:hypothetical protein